MVKQLQHSPSCIWIFYIFGCFYMIKEETSALIDSSVKPNSGYSWIHHFHKVSLTDDISPLHLNDHFDHLGDVVLTVIRI